LHWRQLDDEWVVRAEPGGSLFQLDDLSAVVLGLLEDGPRDSESLVAAIAEACDRPVDAALAAAVQQTLGRLTVDDLVADPRRP
jgi:hypothetical protein